MIDRIDHIVLTVANIDITCTFYAKALGFKIVTFGQGRKALAFGHQKINLHQVGQEIDPKARQPTPGSADFCLITACALEEVVDRLTAANITIETGPVARTGAMGAVTSIYFRDPDGNLVEVARYD